MANPPDMRSHFLKAAIGKWVIIGVLMAGLVRIVLAAIKGTSMTDAIGMAVVGIVLVFLVCVFIRGLKGRER